MRNIDNDQLYIQIRALQADLNDLATAQTGLVQTVTGLGQQVQTLPTPSAAMVNVLRNSDWNYSTSAYTGAGTTTDAAHWYTHFQFRLTDVVVTTGTPARITSATAMFTVAVFAYGAVYATIYGARADGSTISTLLTRVSDTQADMTAPDVADVNASNLEAWFGTDLSETAPFAIKTGAAVQAKWSKATSTVQMGAATDVNRFTIDHPLKTNSCTPSSRQYFQINARLTTGIKPDGVSCYLGIWDGTAGRRRWLEGGNFTLNAGKVGAHTGGATSRTYRIVATTGYGFELQSDDVTVTNTLSTLDTSNYVSLAWDNLTGINEYDVYVSVGGAFYLVASIVNGSYAYFDSGTTLRTLSAFPIVTSTKWRAFIELPPDQFNISADGWIVARASLVVPNTYAMSTTTGKQWLRFGIVDNAGNLVVEVDHIGLCAGVSNSWNISPLDQQASGQPDGNSDNDNQGPIGGGGPIFPPGQGGNGTCIWEGEPVLTPEGEVYYPDFGVGTLVDDGFGNFQPITDLKVAYEHSTALLTTSDGAQLRTSLSHPYIQRYNDFTGKKVFHLQEGDVILTTGVGGVWRSQVTSIESAGPGRVLEITMNSANPRFAAGYGPRKAISRNTKMIDNQS